MHPTRRLLYTFSAALLFAPAFAQTPIQIQVPPSQQPDQVMTLHANARAVLLDVVVTDSHGHTVHGLKASDFHVEEDSQPQTVASIEEHHAPTAEELAKLPKLRDLGPNTFSNRPKPQAESAATVFLLDGLDSSAQAQMYARDQLLSWIKTMQPSAQNTGTQIAIFQLDTQLHLIQGFTSDPAVLEDAVKQRAKPVLPPLPGTGRNYATAAIQMDMLTNAMQTIGKYLQTRPGRKNLVWFTAHIPRTAYDGGGPMGGALLDSQSFLFDYTKATDALRLGEVSVYPIDTRGLEVDPAYSASSSKGPSPRSASEFSARQFFQHNDLDQIADATGGRAFYNTNGIKEVVSQVIETGSGYYTLSFYPTNKQWDGKYRKLKVDLETPPAPAGAQLQYRHGYYAQIDEGPRPEPSYRPDPRGRLQLTHSQPTPDQLAFDRGMHLGAVQLTQIVFATHIDVDPAQHKLAKNQPLPKDNFLEPRYRDHPFHNLKLLYIIPGSQLELPTSPDGTRKGSLEITTLIIDDKDTLVNSFTTNINMDLKPDTFDRLMANGLDIPQTVAVPEKGSYFLRVGVFDKISGKAGTLELSTGDVKLGP